MSISCLRSTTHDKVIGGPSTGIPTCLQFVGALWSALLKFQSQLGGPTKT